MSDKVLAAELDIEISKYQRKMKQALRDAKALDVGLRDITPSARKAQNALAKIGGKVDVNIDVDTSRVAAAESDVRALSQSPNVDVQVDASRVAAADADIRSLTQDAKVSVSVDSGSLSSAQSEVRSAFTNVQLTFDVGQLAGVGAAALTNSPIIGAIQDQEAAARLLAARTDDDVQRVEAVNAVYAQAYGNSREEIAGVAAELARLGVSAEDTESALVSAFNVAAVEGQDVMAILDAQRVLISSGLAGDYTEAADIIATGFKEGANAGGDFLDTLREYSVQFADAGVSAEGFISLITSGLESGAFDSDKPADLFKESIIRLNEAIADEESAPAQAIERIGAESLVASYEAGSINGDEYVRGIIEAVKENGTTFDLFEILGTPAEDITSGVTMNLEFDTVTIEEGAAQRGADIINDTLATQWTATIRVIETELADAMRIGGAPLTEILDNARESLTEFVAEIAGGAGIPEALEIALEAPGLAEDIRSLQASLGGFTIEFSLALANILAGLGQGDAATALRTGAADMAQQQLVFDLTFLDSDQAGAALATAIRRGVDDAGIEEALVEAGSNFIDNNSLKDFEALLDRLSEGTVVEVEVSRAGMTQSRTFELSGETPEEAQARLQEAINTAFPVEGAGTFATVTVTPITEFDTEAVREEVLAIRDDLDNEASTAINNFRDLAVSGMADFETGIDDARIMIGTIPLAAIDANEALIEPVDSMVTQMMNLRDVTVETANAFADVETGIASVLNFASGGVGIPGKAKGGPVSGGSPYIVGEQGMELFIPSTSGTIIPNGQTMSMMGGATINNNVVYNVGMSLNAGNLAQATAAGGRFANQIRGFN